MSITLCPSSQFSDKIQHGYHYLYDMLFSKLQSSPINLLEIGVSTAREAGGTSLWMWKEYFVNGKVCGLDIDPACKFFERPDVPIYIGSQTDTQVLDTIVNERGLFDIIIDDGSHVNNYTIKTFNHLWKSIKPGGFYIIEDLHCSYDDLPSHNVHKIWPGMKYNPENEIVNKREEIDQFLQTQCHLLDAGKEFKAILAMPKIVAFIKQ